MWGLYFLQSQLSCQTSVRWFLFAVLKKLLLNAPPFSFSMEGKVWPRSGEGYGSASAYIVLCSMWHC